MRGHSRILPILAACALLVLALPVLSAVDCEQGDNAHRLQNRYFVDECRKAQTELNARADAVARGFGPFQGSDSLRAWPGKAQEQLKQSLARVSADKAAAASAGDARLVSSFEELERRLLEAIRLTAGLTDLNDLGHPDSAGRFPELQPDFWKVSSDPADSGGLAAKYLADSDCLDVPASTARCTSPYEHAVQIGDHTYVVSAIIARLHAPLRQQFRDEAERRTNAWNAYLYDAQFQYWWELAFNRYLETQCPGFHRSIASLISRSCAHGERDEFGNELGFREPPNFKATVLHPDLGVMYLDAEPNGDRFKPAVVIQVIGYEWWDWNASRIENRRGLSLVATASDNSRVSALGVGLQFRWGGYALALTSHGGELAVTLNLDLVGHIAEVNPKWAEELKQPLEFK
jgi:hypothetical protein